MYSVLILLLCRQSVSLCSSQPVKLCPPLPSGLLQCSGAFSGRQHQCSQSRGLIGYKWVFSVPQKRNALLCRTNVAYTLNNGQVFVKAYISNVAQPCTITLSVNAGITATPSGARNKAVEYSLRYTPRHATLDWLGFGIGSSISYLVTGSVASTFIACHLGYLTPAGKRRAEDFMFESA